MTHALFALFLVLLAIDWLQTLQIIKPGGPAEKNILLVRLLAKTKTNEGHRLIVHAWFAGALGLSIAGLLYVDAGSFFNALAISVVSEVVLVINNHRVGARF